MCAEFFFDEESHTNTKARMTDPVMCRSPNVAAVIVALIRCRASPSATLGTHENACPEARRSLMSAFAARTALAGIIRQQANHCFVRDACQRTSDGHQSVGSVRL